MRRFFTIIGLVLLGSLSCLASGIPSKAVSAQPTTCQKVSTMTTFLTTLPFSELVFTGITPIGGLSAAHDDDLKDDDKGCCWIGVGASTPTYKQTTWKDCKDSTKQITGADADPKDFHKDKACPSK
jgi:hypothetical protein